MVPQIGIEPTSPKGAGLQPTEPTTLLNYGMINRQRVDKIVYFRLNVILSAFDYGRKNGIYTTHLAPFSGAALRIELSSHKADKN